MKAAVVIPPIQDFYFTPHRLSALGARSLLPLLHQAGWNYEFFDFPLSKKKPYKINLPAALSYLQDFIVSAETGPISFFTSYRHLGPSFCECAEQIIKSGADVILISCFAFAYSEETLSLARELRSRKTDAVIAVGGGAVCADASFFIQQQFEDIALFDFIFFGEAEISLPPFLQGFPQLIKQRQSSNIEVPNCFRNNAFSLTDRRRGKETAGFDYLNGRARIFTDRFDLIYGVERESKDRIMINTALSRGCPHYCRFCSNYVSHGRLFRKVSKKSLSEALGELPKNKKLIINIEDDNLLFNTDYLFESLTLIKQRYTDVEFIAENGLDVSRLDPQLIKTLLSFGFRQFNLSLVSAAEQVLAKQLRPFRREKFEACLDFINASGIPSITYFICGLPEDNADQTIRTLRYLDRIKTRIGISLFYPVPGLPGAPNRKKKNAENGESASPAVFRSRGESTKLWAGSSAYPWSGSLSSRQMITAFRLARYLNFRARGCFDEEEKKLIETIEKEKKLYSFIKDGKARKIISVDHLDRAMVRAVLN